MKLHKCTDPVGVLYYFDGLCQCSTALGANTHRHECKLPTYKVLEGFFYVLNLSWLLVFLFLTLLMRRKVGEKQLLVLSSSD